MCQELAATALLLKSRARTIEGQSRVAADTLAEAAEIVNAKAARVRPYNIDPKVKPLQQPNWAAFPSGHSFYAHMLAYLYSELAPEFSDIFLNDARAIAHFIPAKSSVFIFPSDSEAARVFARQFVDQLLLTEKFRPELEKIKKGSKFAQARPIEGKSRSCSSSDSLAVHVVTVLRLQRRTIRRELRTVSGKMCLVLVLDRRCARLW